MIRAALIVCAVLMLVGCARIRAAETDIANLHKGEVVTAGGRVLDVTALGSTIAVAKLNAYRAVKLIRWPGAWCRS